MDTVVMAQFRETFREEQNTERMHPAKTAGIAELRKI